jgi:membrane protein
LLKQILRWIASFQTFSQQKLQEQSKSSRFFYHPLFLLLESLKKFRKDNCLLKASALAYQFVFALVPITVLSFSIFTVIPQLETARSKVEKFLYSHLLPNSGEIINNYINDFSHNAKTLGIVGFFSFMVIFVLLLDNIERCFNDIWFVLQKRTLYERLIAITMMILWGPFLIGLSIYVENRLSAFIPAGLDTTFLDYLSVVLIPFLITQIAFTLIYLYVPYTKVSFPAALIGGLVTNTLLEVVRYGFNAYTGNISYRTIYGPISLIPIFLFWVYLCWVIILFGTEISFTIQNMAFLKNKRQHPEGSLNFFIAIAIMFEICRNFLEELPPLHPRLLPHILQTPEHIVRTVIGRLVQRNLITITESGHLMPSKNPEMISLKHIKNAISPKFFYLPEESSHPALANLLDGMFGEIAACEDNLLAPLNIKEIIDTMMKEHSIPSLPLTFGQQDNNR